MNNSERNIDVLEHIMKYCNEISLTHERFGNSVGLFHKDFIYRNAISMCILQIGELSKHLSEDFKETYNEVPWHGIKGLRNFVAHQYGDIDIDLLWTTATERIGELGCYCRTILENYYILEQPIIENILDDEEELEL